MANKDPIQRDLEELGRVLGEFGGLLGEMSVQMGNDLSEAAARGMADLRTQWERQQAREREQREHRVQRRGRNLPGYALNLTLGIVGAVLGGSFALTALGCGIPAVVLMAADDLVARILWTVTAVFAVMTAPFARMSVVFLQRAACLRRAPRYLEQMEETGWAEEELLARSAGVSLKRVQKDLRLLMKMGVPAGCHYDEESGRFYLRRADWLAEQERQTADRRAEQAEQAAQAAPDDTAAMLRQGRGFVEFLHTYRGSFAPETQAEMDRLGSICSDIWSWVEKNPASAPKVRRLVSYYLPTTRKLILAAHTAAGQNGAAAMEIGRRVTGTLRDLNAAFERLRDDLMVDLSMDVSSEIAAMEAMLRQDGLTGSGLTL